jgi:hypothetical protein
MPADSMSSNLAKKLELLFDWLDSEKNHRRLESLIVWLSVTSFVFHLLLIFIARINTEFGKAFGIGHNFLQAVYTPFSFILFYEVLLLVFALPRSLTSSIAKQYQIISLIVVRRVFKDIGSFDNFGHWIEQPDSVRLVLYDMAAALLMFLTVAIFLRVRELVAKTYPPGNLAGFIFIKKMIALLLALVLILLAFFNLANWFTSFLPFEFSFLTTPENPDAFFFPAFFEFMIFTDVFLLIVSISYYDRYEHVFRNAGFVISTVLLRISLSTSQPASLVIALVAMVYGLGVISVFAYCSRRTNPMKLTEVPDNQCSESAV